MSIVGNFLKRVRGEGAGQPSVPEGVRAYAIGDIHGKLDLLESLLSRIEADARQAEAPRKVLVYIGDYVDRGPFSRQVIDRVMAVPHGFEAHFLRGNHDETVLEFLKDPKIFPMWRGFGGLETLVSYGMRPHRLETEEGLGALRDEFARVLPASHRRFLETLEASFSLGDYFFAHAGARPGVALEFQELHDLMWIRDEFLEYGGSFGKVVVHGHTPAPQPVVRKNRIGIDTGAYATGILTALVLEGSARHFLKA